MRIAAQIYDFVDGHIRQLDEDLRAFDSDLYSDRARLGLKVGLVRALSGHVHHACIGLYFMTRIISPLETDGDLPSFQRSGLNPYPP